MKRSQLITLAIGLLPAALSAQNFNATQQQQALIAEIPADSAERAREIFTELGKDLDKLVPEFASALTTEHSDADTTARYALGGLVWTIGHSGSQTQKEQLAQLIADNINKAEGVEPQSFLIEQLQYLDQDTIAEALYPLMTDKDLGQRTIRTLTALNPDDLAEKLLAGLNDSNTTGVQTALLHSIARVATPEGAADKIAPLANAQDHDVREAALDALAAIGDPKSREALKSQIQQSETFYDQLAPARYLDYAKAVAKSDKDLAAEICREMLATEYTTPTAYLKALSLTTLAYIVGEQVQDDAIAHIKADEEDVRATALDVLNRFDSPEVTSRIVQQLEQSPDPEVTIGILLGLGDRGDAAALPAVIGRFADEDETVAIAAINNAGEIDRAQALPGYLEALKSEKSKAVIDAIYAQLLRVKSEQLLPAVAAALPAATVEGQVALVTLLGERRAVSQKEVVFEATKSDNARVRNGAYEALGRVAEAADLQRLREMILAAESKAERNAARKAFVAAAKEAGDPEARSQLLLSAFDGASLEGKTSLMEAMAALADKQTLELVVQTASTSATPELQSAAVRALSEWQSQDAVPALAEIAGKSEVETHQVLAVRGYTRLAGELKNDRRAQMKMYRNALRFAKRDDELKTIISQLGDVRTTAALKALAPYVDREGVAAEAASAAVKIALPARNYEGIKGAEAAEILQRALPQISDKEQRKEIEKHIYSIVQEVYLPPLPEDNEGYAILFNGRDLSGWCGDTDGYMVEKGALVCKADSGGKLYTEREFGDYILKFEFKLPAGGNNGVGIRTPLHGNPAYDGMEIQILDDKHESFKDIKDWQRHGSVYGVAPSLGAELKIDDWNTQEIEVVGPNLKVTVNGKVITEVNLDEAAKAGSFPSGKEHPGIERNRGHVGFLGHGHRVDFRNIRLKNIANEAPEGFTALYNGENLDGWKGLVANPVKRKEMTPEVLQDEQAKADQKLHDHWESVNGILFFDGEGSHACTIKDYANFEMLVDWCIVPGGDNGIYLRGTPQVQIWDPHYWPQGSGGLYNNQKGTSDPLVLADKPISQWNQFRIKMIDDKVTVHLNDTLVVDNVVLENYWDRKSPIFPSEQIELQSHGSPAWFRNVYIRELQ